MCMLFLDTNLQVRMLSLLLQLIFTVTYVHMTRLKPLYRMCTYVHMYVLGSIAGESTNVHMCVHVYGVWNEVGTH